MKRTLIALLLLAGPLTLPLTGQEGNDEDKAAIAEALTELESAIKGRITNDQIHFVKQLGEKWKSADARQRKKAFTLAKKNLKSKERTVREATVIALATMGGGKKNKDAKSATKILFLQVKNKKNKSDLPFIAACLKSVGRLGTKPGAQDLAKLLNHKDNEVIAGSLEGIAFYRDADFKVRRDLVDSILKIYSSTYSQALDARNKTAKAKLGAIELQAEAALAALSKRGDVKGAADWIKWWNKEGKRAKKW